MLPCNVHAFIAWCNCLLCIVSARGCVMISMQPRKEKKKKGKERKRKEKKRKATSDLVLQLRLRATVMTFFGLSLILLWIVKLNSCASFQFSWLGLTPMQVYCCLLTHTHSSSVVHMLFAPKHMRMCCCLLTDPHLHLQSLCPWIAFKCHFGVIFTETHTSPLVHMLYAPKDIQSLCKVLQIHG